MQGLAVDAASASDIRRHLADTLPAQRGERFAQLLGEAQSVRDFARVATLLRGVEPLLEGSPVLRQWHTYTLGYLALDAHQRPAEAARHLETLRAELDTLEPTLQGRVLNGLGIIYVASGRLDRALLCYQACQELFEQAENLLGLGKALTNLAALHYSIQDYGTAREYAARSAALLEQNPAERVWQVSLANAQGEIGLAQMRLGNLAAARDAFEAYLDISTRWGYGWGQGISCDNLGHVYRQLGELERAETCYHTARYVSLQAGNRPEATEALYGLGLVAMARGTEPNTVRRRMAQALARARRLHHHEIITDILLSRAEWAERQGDLAVALHESRAAVATIESLRANNAAPEDRARLTGARIEAYEQTVRRLCLAHETHAEAYRFVEMAKSRSLIEMLGGQVPTRSERVPTRWLERQGSLREALHAAYAQPAAAATVAGLEQELDTLSERIRRQDAEYASFQSVLPLSLDEVVGRLPAGALLLEYFTVGDAIWAFVVSARGLRVVRLPVGLAQVARSFVGAKHHKIGHLLHLTRDADHRLHVPWFLHSLGEALLAPLGPEVWEAPLLCIIPHGLLHYIPFHALYRGVDADPHYLGGSVSAPRAIVYAPSATVLLDFCQRKLPALHGGCLALGYNTEALTQAEAEARAIARVTGGTSLVGAEATRAALLTQGATYRYVHLACHGAFNPTWPMLSRLHLADSTLDLGDILQHLRLNADLVSLSACETGRSHILRGDELVGLARAFLYAGTPSVAVSHWMVDDLPTRLLMERFYYELQRQPSSKALALSRAQHALRSLTLDELRHTLRADGLSPHETDQQLAFLAASAGLGPFHALRGDECLLAHPYYWAAFFLVGDRLPEE